MSTHAIDVQGPLDDETMPVLAENNNNDIEQTAKSKEGLACNSSTKQDKEFHELIKKMTIDIQGILCQKPTTGQERGYVEEKYLVRTMSNIAKSGDALIDKFEKASERGIQAAIDDELDSLREDVGLQRQITTDLAKIVEVSAEVINRNGNITNMKKDHKKIKERRLQLKKEKQVLATVSDNLNNLKEKVASIASKTNELTAEVQQIKKKHPKK